ncbi:MAG: hypothetical protein AAF519_19225, partial [Bacteroidota bacterium]
QEEVQKTASGRSMVDGASKIEDGHKTEVNRKIVTEFCDKVLIGGQYHLVPDYISSEEYIQHSPAVEDGIRGFQKFTQDLDAKGLAMRYKKIHKLLVQGNFATTLSEVQMDNEDWCIIDIYRLKKGKIVEHWDVIEKIGPKETWNNSGKF